MATRFKEVVYAKALSLELRSVVFSAAIHCTWGVMSTRFVTVRFRHEQTLTICNILEKNFCRVTKIFTGYVK